MWLQAILMTCVIGSAIAKDDIDALIGEVFGPNNNNNANNNNANNNNNNNNNNNEGRPQLVNPIKSADEDDFKTNEANPNAGIGGGECQCVPYYLCANNTIIVDGAGLLDIRIKQPECDNYMDVCCKEPLDPGDKIVPKPHGRQGCGKRNIDGVGFRITGAVDNESQFGEFPWMIAVLKEDIVNDGNKLKVYQCGGALIHQQVVLTAAHCVNGKDPGSLKIRAGEWDTQTKNELYPHQDRDVAQVIIHEHYYAGALYNDIALLILKDPVQFADNVDIICLPKQGDVVLNNECYASGWGKDVFGKEGQYQVILKKIDLPIVDRKSCIEALRKTRLGPYFRLHNSFICAGGVQGKDTCKGDGGSPLICPIPGREYQYQQVGMVAWGIGCGGDTPAVYVNIAYLRDWIDLHMKKFNFVTEYTY